MRRFDLIVALSVLAVASGIAVWQLWFPGREFDPAVWKDETQIQEGVRVAMADRLLARGTLLGKTRQEVVELLGKPTPTGDFREWDMVYWLGYMSIDEWSLVLRLSDGRVCECRTIPD
jgi:hypothetical protein